MSDSYARGGRPHSVPDPDGKAYDAMIRKHQALMAQKQAEAARPSAPNRHSQIDAAVSGIAHTLNGARSARHEFEQGHRARALVDAVTAGIDVGSIALLLKDGLKLKGPHDWKSTRKWMGGQGILEKNQHGHHGLIPRKEWGKSVPDVIKNQPPNIRPMESPVAHSRIRGKSIKASLPRFTPFERYVHGTPRWWKAANVAAVGHATQIAGDHLPGHSPQRSTHKK